MKTPKLLAMLAGCALMCTPALAQKEGPKPAGKPAAPAAQPEKKPSPSEEAAMKAMMEAGAPNEHHKNLEQLVGEWDAVVKYREGAEQPWTENKGSCSAHMIYEGRFLHESFMGDMAGMPFKGTSIMGYNNPAKQYESTWIDSMSTGIMFMTGSYDAAKKSFTISGDSFDPMQGGKKKHTRIVTTIVSPDKHTEEFFEPGMDGKEFKSMEITYTRKAGGAPMKNDAAK